MDTKEIINEIEKWCKVDTKNRCAFVLLAKDNGEETTNCCLLVGSFRIMTTSLAVQMNRHDDTLGLIKNSLIISDLMKLTESNEKEVNHE